MSIENNDSVVTPSKRPSPSSESTIPKRAIPFRDLISKFENLSVKDAPPKENLRKERVTLKALEEKPNKVDQSFKKLQSRSEVELPHADKYGNKTANLLILKDLSGELRNAGIPVRVPDFLPISHDQIQSHLKEHYPEYEMDWEKFNALREGSSILSEESKAILRDIQTKIGSAFADHPLQVEGVEEFLTKNQEASLMVRSTGKEDTKDLANAGGNESVAAVAPNAKDVSLAIGRVISSYHSELSLTQRALAKDDISVLPFTPVLLQIMIGEHPSHREAVDNIPVSGIAYTREVLGKTESLTQIQTAYGHNEAVVNTQVPVDTYYAYGDGSHHEIIRPKTQRLIADMLGGFIVQENPPGIAEQAALNPQQIRDLQKISQKIHDHYGQPMDIEWVFEPEKGIFNIVQARPLVERSKASPSTIDAGKLEGLQRTFNGEPIVSNNGAVAVLASPDEMISDTNLERAFNRYWKMAKTEEGANIKAIIIRRPAAATSHFACTLREMGVAVFSCPQFDEKAIPSRGNYLIIDSQQGKLFSVEQSKEPVGSHELMETLQNTQAIKEGWYHHPIAALETVQALDFSENVKLLDGMYKTLLGGHVLDNPPQSAEDVRALLEKVSSSDPKVAQEAVKDLMHWLFNQVKVLEKDPYLFDRGIMLLKNAATIGHRILEEERPHMERLHAAKRLEALLMQKATASIVNSDSLWQVLQQKGALKKSEIKEVELSEDESKSLKLLQKTNERF